MVIRLSLAKGLDKMHVKYISSKRTGEDCSNISSKEDDDVEKDDSCSEREEEEGNDGQNLLP